MKEYVCECGRVFTEPNSFNGHKSGCRIHHEAKGTLEQYEQKILKTIEFGKKGREAFIRNVVSEKQRELEQWISEQHLCERCGKVMTEKYGSGRFCCRACANSRSLDLESRESIKESVSRTARSKYKLNPRYCSCCNKELSWEEHTKDICEDCYKRNKHLRLLKKEESKSSIITCCHCGKRFDKETSHFKYQSYCSRECMHNHLSEARYKAFENGNIKHSGVRAKYKYGTYKGFYCDSSWELAFITYCLDNGIEIQRNTTLKFPYSYKGKEHLYFPDFIINNNLVEIKGRITDDVEIKTKAVPSIYSLTILYKEDMKPYIQYVKQIYGKNFCEVLYDRNFPCYLDKVK